MGIHYVAIIKDKNIRFVIICIFLPLEETHGHRLSKSGSFQKEAHASITNRKGEEANGCEPWQNRDHRLETSKINPTDSVQPQVSQPLF